jgi:hypothetical protein
VKRHLKKLLAAILPAMPRRNFTRIFLSPQRIWLIS